MTSSPTEMRPERSAAPPCITRAISMRPVPSSALIVAPYVTYVITVIKGKSSGKAFLLAQNSLLQK